MTTQGQYENRLIKEKSPYLLQHANNPVDWYPWGDEAFEKARKEDKPVFLSIGYSTCHWCHVMEHESFEVPEIAEKINEYFIPIKVDREERPDIDNIYMTAVQAMTGRGGWPLTAILTPDRKPFYGGTYFPPYGKWGAPGLLDVMESINSSWKNNRAQLLQSSETLTEMIRESLPQGGSEKDLIKEVLTLSYTRYEQTYDERFGGFGTAPKFPTSHNLSFLLRYARRTDSAKSFEMVENTLTKMAEGGMYDHVGGGFHRYSTDQYWQIPHFEKMLYDQAILAKTYLEAYQHNKNEYFETIAREIFEYVLRDLHHDQGGFYSAEDADSLDPDVYGNMSADLNQAQEKKEGAFYLWRKDEIEEILGKEQADIFNYHFGIKENGNAHSDPHNEFTGKNIIFVENSLEETAKKFKVSVEDLKSRLHESKKKLFNVREKRPHSYLDDKILVDWNGLMISSLAFGSRVLNDEQYLQAAEKAAQFIIKTLIRKDGRLLHRYRDGEASILGAIEDYAFFIHGLLDLYEASFKTEYLKLAEDIADDMIDLFWDKKNGGFFFTAKDAEKLIFRQKEIYDGAIPSGNSVAALDLVRLYHYTLDKKWEEKAQELFRSFSSEISNSPSAYSQMLIAFDYAIGPSQEIVIAAKQNDKVVEDIVKETYKQFIPNKVVILRLDSDKDILKLSPFVKEQAPLDGETTVYVCENHVCKLPVKDVESFQKLLENLNTK